MLKVCKEWEDREIKRKAIEMFKPLDQTHEISREKRQLDAFALLTNGDNICTAAAIFEDQLYISNNTNKKEELIHLYSEFFIDVIEKKEVNIVEKKRLIKLSYSKERERVKTAHWLGGVEKKLKGLAVDPESYLKGFYEKKELELKRAEERLKNEEEKLLLLEAYEPDEETKLKMAEIERKQEIECEIQKELVDERRAIRIAKQNGEGGVEQREIETENKVHENRRRLKLLKEELGVLRKTPEKVDSKEIIHRTKDKIQGLTKNLKKLKTAKLEDVVKQMKKELEDEKILAEEDLEYKRGKKFLKRLKRAMERILKGLLDPEGNSPFSLEMLKNIIFTVKKDVHAEMSIIDKIWEKIKASGASGKEFFSHRIYIGLNKLCCYHCMSTICQINEVADKKVQEKSSNNFIQTRGAHHKSYGKWASPDILNTLDLKHPDQVLADLGISEDDFRTQTNNNYEDADTSASLIDISIDEDYDKEDNEGEKI